MTPRGHDVTALSWVFPEGIPDESVEYRGLVLPRRFIALVSHPDWPVSARLTVTVDPERGPIATGLEALDPPAGSDTVNYRELAGWMVKTMDTPTMLQNITASAKGFKLEMDALDKMADGPDKTSRLQVASPLYSAATRQAFAGSAPRRRHLLTAKHLEGVAAVYRAALEQGRPPTMSVAKHYSIEHSTATKWVRKARDNGSLRAAKGTQPGEEDR